MREGNYELSVIDKNGVAFNECGLDGKNYVRAEPGKEYNVRFTIHPDAGGNFPYACVICILTIDGCKIDNGFYQNLASEPCVFWFHGMRVSSDTVQVFKFSDVKVASEPIAGNSEDTINIGQIKVDLYEARCTGKPAKCTEIYNSINASTSIKEGKKFWQQPSLATARGSLKAQARIYPTLVYEKLRQTPDATLTLHYHAADVLDVLQVLHNKKHAPPAPVPPPVHFDFSAEPDAVPVVPVPTVVVDLRQDEIAGVAVKVEKMQKKRKLGRSSSDQRSVELVDLTM